MSERDWATSATDRITTAAVCFVVAAAISRMFALNSQLTERVEAIEASRNQVEEPVVYAYPSGNKEKMDKAIELALSDPFPESVEARHPDDQKLYEAFVKFERDFRRMAPRCEAKESEATP